MPVMNVSNRNNDIPYLSSLPTFVSIVPASFHEGVNYEPHVHEYAEIMLITEGSAIQCINRKQYPVKAGDIVVLNQGCLHAERTEKGSAEALITCKLTDVHSELLPDGHLIPDTICPVFESGGSYDELFSIYKELYFEKSFQDEFSDKIIAADVQRLLSFVFRKMKNAPWLSPKSGKIDNIVDSIRQYIDDHYTEDLSLESLSAEFFISSSFLVHAFKREVGESPINYMINRRMGEAQRYLSFTDLSVAEIAYRIGYENVSYFNKIFLKRTGLQPSMFRDLYSFKEHMNDDSNNYLKN